LVGGSFHFVDGFDKNLACAIQDDPSTIQSSHHRTNPPPKNTRYEVERDHYNADGEELRRLLAVRGIMYDRLKRSSDAHSYALNEVRCGG
jgi:hypothetical protein